MPAQQVTDLRACHAGITSLTESSMEGSFTGNAFQFDENNDISSIVGVDVQFRAGLWDGGEWPCQ